ncbi:MAG: ABC-2 transporter permease [Ruminococcaceae bacterium]|nr:ABC-2 transporter permease [Oscillospiraceae bacterium]
MKGLLLKDLYMMRKYCRFTFIVAIFFIGISFLNTSNLLFIFYPCMLCGMVPVTLISYDEHSKWLQYSQTMPYTKAQIVSGKYLIGLFMQIAVILLVGIAQVIRMNIYGSFVLSEFLVLMMLLLILSSVSSSICLPFMFRFGVEKGRIAYYFMIGMVCAGSVLSSSLLSSKLQATIRPNGILPIICLVGIGIYALSWYMSIVLYKKREI